MKYARYFSLNVNSLMYSTLWLCLCLFSFKSQASLPDFTELVEETSPSVVNIATIKHGTNYSNLAEHYNLPPEVPELFRHFFGPHSFDKSPGSGQQGQGKPEKSSLGSGFIISNDGYILTNNHVVKDADEIIVRLSDRRELVAQLIGADERSDLALLKVEAEGLPEVELGNSDKLKVGEWVLAIGSPFGFDYSVTPTHRPLIYQSCPIQLQAILPPLPSAVLNQSVHPHQLIGQLTLVYRLNVQ
jgi:serine protease Do